MELFGGLAERLSAPDAASRLPKEPVAFAGTIGLSLWPKLEQIAHSVRDNRYTVVESGHGVGKSILAGALVAWWIETHRPKAKVVTLAPTYAQVQHVLWRYIRQFSQNAPFAGTVFDFCAKFAKHTRGDVIGRAMSTVEHDLYSPEVY